MREAAGFTVDVFDPSASAQPIEIATAHLRVREWQVEVGQNTFSDIEESQRDLKALEEYYIASGGNFFVAQDDAGLLVGFVGLRGDGNGEGMVKRLAVLPEYHRNGIGRALVGELVEWAQGHGFRKLVLHTNRREHARTVYEEVGFCVTGFIPEHDDWIMELYL